MDLTVVIPYRDGQEYIHHAIEGIPAEIPVIVVDDASDEPVQLNPLHLRMDNVQVIRLNTRHYFAGAVNVGVAACKTDVLVLNQDIWFEGLRWLDILAENRERCAMIGERIEGEHPAFETGYIHGTFMFLRRDAWAAVGPMNEWLYPLWGCTAEWQIRAARKGFKILPLSVPGFHHKRRGAYGASIERTLKTEKDKVSHLIRTPPEVSVIIPCYNQGRYLQDAVNSLIGGPTSLGPWPGQTFQSFEVIIVNDASTDDTAEHLAKIVDPWKLVRGYTRKDNGGTAAAHNTGIRQSRGRFITTMSADDMRRPQGLEKLYKACLENPHSVACDDVQRFAQGTLGRVDKMAEYDFDKLVYKNSMHVGIMYPKQAWVEAGGYSEQMRHGREDWEFNVALGLKGWCGVNVREANYLYRREGQNRTAVNTTAEWREHFLKQIQGIHPEAYGGHRPMACCGGRANRQTASRQSRRQSVVRRTVQTNLRSTPPQEQVPLGMIQVTYTGRNVGTTSWGGPATVPSGRTYKFGASERYRTRWVDKRDIDYFRNISENGKKIFRIHPQIVGSDEVSKVIPKGDHNGGDEADEGRPEAGAAEAGAAEGRAEDQTAEQGADAAESKSSRRPKSSRGEGSGESKGARVEKRNSEHRDQLGSDAEVNPGSA